MNLSSAPVVNNRKKSLKGNEWFLREEITQRTNVLFLEKASRIIGKHSFAVLYIRTVFSS